MKKVWKVMGLFQTLLIASALIFAGCNKDVTSDPVEDPVDYTLVAAGDEVTVNVGQTIKIKAEGKNSAEYSLDGLSITHKGDGIFEISAASTMSDASVNVNLYDGSDEDEGINITVWVYDPYYNLKITLDDAVAQKAKSITVYAEGKEDGESTAAKYQTVEANYTAGDSTAIAKLEKEKANSYDWFNNIDITVKDADGNEIDVEINPVYFCYSATSGNGFLGEDGIKVTAAVASKIFTINFEGFTIPGGSVTGVKYATEWDNDSNGPAYSSSSAVTPTVTVADDGDSATFSVASTSEFYIDWTAVVVKDSEGNTISISAGNTVANQWYSYSGDVWSNTLTHVSGEYVNICNAQAWSNTDSGTGDVYVQVLEAADFTSLNISTLRVRITLSTGSWAHASSADAWASATYANTAWSADANANEVIITSEDFISALSTNGLYVATSAGSSGTVTVDYIAK